MLVTRRKKLLGLLSPILFEPKKDLNIGILGAPFCKGQNKQGVQNGPKAIREVGIIESLRERGHDVQDYYDVEDNESNNVVGNLGPSGEKHITHVLKYSRRLSTKVKEVIQDDKICVTLGGDHSIAIGTVAGHVAASKGKEVVLLWVDAHADINTGATSPSGHMHGMAAAYLLVQLSEKLHRLFPDHWPTPKIESKNLAYIGLRDLDEPETQMLNNLGILAYGMRQIDLIGIEQVTSKCLNYLNPSATRPLHLSFDIDVLDPSEAPSTGTPEHVRSTTHMRALDLVEVNPLIGSKNEVLTTTLAARQVLLGVLDGHRDS